MDIKGRGSSLSPKNRFEKTACEVDWEQIEDDDEWMRSFSNVETEYLVDESQSIVSENKSPDLGFRYSVNPYRGCAHGCSYCYARPTHEYLGFNAGIDFESKIMVKPHAAALFRQWLARDAWVPEMIAFSGVTDCYQPAERHYRLTHQCLDVAVEARQPIGIVTKNALVARDLDLLVELQKYHAVAVAISITTLDKQLARTMEPRTSAPHARLRALQALSAAGIPTSVMVSPVIPGLNDHEIPAILEAAANAGAMGATYILIRLPQTVQPVFLDWLERTVPGKSAKIENRIRAIRDGELNNSQFGQRMRGTGEIADQIRQSFHVFKKKYGLDAPFQPLSTEYFVPPKPKSGQLRLF